MEIYFEGGKKVNVNYNGFTIKTDQPVKGGGEGSAPTPFDLFLASLGACAGVYIKGFCDQRGLDASKIKLLQKMHYDSNEHLMKRFDIEIQLPSDFPDKYANALINAAGLCAVKRHLNQSIETNIYTKVVYDY